MYAVLFGKILCYAQLIMQYICGIISAEAAEFLYMRCEYEPACVVPQLIYMRSKRIYAVCVNYYRTVGIFDKAFKQAVGFVTVADTATEKYRRGGLRIFAQLVGTIGCQRLTAERQIDALMQSVCYACCHLAYRR